MKKTVIGIAAFAALDRWLRHSRKSSGSFAIFAAIRRASSIKNSGEVGRFRDQRPHYIFRAIRPF